MQDFNVSMRILVDLINCAINGKRLPDGVDYKDTLKLAYLHGLENIAYYVYSNDERVDSETLKRSKDLYYKSLTRLATQEDYKKQVVEKFYQLRIKHMPLKGSIIRDYYPKKDMRFSADVDIFYDDTNKTIVRKIFKELGFNATKDEVGHDIFDKDDIIFEMHHFLVKDPEKFHNYYIGIWDRLKSSDNIRYDFTESDFYIYMLIHAFGHFSLRGAGIRVVLDIYIFNKYAKNLDYDYIESEFNKLGIQKFHTALKRLADAWFNFSPLDSDLALLGDYILNCGVYGRVNNAVLMQATKVDEFKDSKKSLFISRVFPKYSKMKAQYRVLKKLPILLPFLWVYRWFEVLLYRRKNIKRDIAGAKEITEDSFVKMKKIKEITGIED